MQNLEPKNGDFVRYIENLHRQQSRGMREAIQESHKRLLQEIQTQNTPPSPERNWGRRTNREDNPWQTLFQRMKSQVRQKGPRTSQQSHPLVLFAMGFIFYALMQLQEMLDGVREWDGLPIFLLFLAFACLAFWLKGLTKGKNKGRN